VGGRLTGNEGVTPYIFKPSIAVQDPDTKPNSNVWHEFLEIFLCVWVIVMSMYMGLTTNNWGAFISEFKAKLVWCVSTWSVEKTNCIGIAKYSDQINLSLWTNSGCNKVAATVPDYSNASTWHLHEEFFSCASKQKRALKPYVCWLLDLCSSQGPTDQKKSRLVKYLYNSITYV